MEKKDYSAQKKHIRTHYTRFPLDLRPEVLAEFKAVYCRKWYDTNSRDKKVYRFIL